MDIKNLLCPLSTDEIIMNDVEFPKLRVSVDETASSWSSSCSSSTASPPSCYESPVSPTPSPPASPAAFPLLIRQPTIPHQSVASANRPTSNRQQRTAPQTRTPWTPEEDHLLQQGHEQGLSWAMISATYLPHRSRGCCWGRFKTLQTKALEQREWTAAEDRMLMLAIKKHSRLFKQAWKSVAQDLGNRSWKECELRSSKIANTIRKKQHPRTY